MAPEEARQAVLECPVNGTVQFSEVLSPAVIDVLADEMANRHDLLLRAYGRSIDPALTFLDAFPTLHRLSIDLWHCESFVPVGRFTELVELSLGETRSTRPSLAVLEHLPHLQSLWIANHSKMFEVIATLTKLRFLSLRANRNSTLQPLAHHPALETFWMSFGRCRDLTPLALMPRLTAAAIHQVRQFRSVDLDPLAAASGLRTMELQNLPQVDSLDRFAEHASLRHVHLDGMRGIGSGAPLGRCEHLEVVVASNSRPRDQKLTSLLGSDDLRHVSIGDSYSADEIDRFLSAYAGTTFWYRGQMLRGDEILRQGVWSWNFWHYASSSFKRMSQFGSEQVSK